MRHLKYRPKSTMAVAMAAVIGQLACFGGAQAAAITVTNPADANEECTLREAVVCL